MNTKHASLLVTTGKSRLLSVIETLYWLNSSQIWRIMQRTECTCTPAVWARTFPCVKMFSLVPLCVRCSSFPYANSPPSVRALTHSPPLVPCPQDRPVAASAPLRQWGIKTSAGAGERVILCNAQRVSVVRLESGSGEDALARLLLDAQRRWRRSDFGVSEKTCFSFLFYDPAPPCFFSSLLF